MKPLRAFPFPLNIGTDICQISRIFGILQTQRAVRFVNRILAPEEQAWKDARLNILARSPPPNRQSRTTGAFKAVSRVSHEELAAQDPELWKCAAFIAGRYALSEMTGFTF